jgi:hypothetical protein
MSQAPEVAWLSHKLESQITAAGVMRGQGIVGVAFVCVSCFRPFDGSPRPLEVVEAVKGALALSAGAPEPIVCDGCLRSIMEAAERGGHDLRHHEEWLRRHGVVIEPPPTSTPAAAPPPVEHEDGPFAYLLN